MERFAGDAVLYEAEHAARFVSLGPEGESAVRGRSGGRVAFVRVTSPGSHIVVYHSTRTRHEMAAEAFEKYLAEEGLPAIIADRAQRGEQASPGREVYSRCAKVLLQVGAPTELRDREVGLPLELVLESVPPAPGPSSRLQARVLYAGAPLAGARVVAVAQSRPEALATDTSDEQGRVAFDMPQGGAWMLTTVHMVRAPASLHADWESLWASLTIGVPPPATTESEQR